MAPALSSSNSFVLRTTTPPPYHHHHHHHESRRMTPPRFHRVFAGKTTPSTSSSSSSKANSLNHLKEMLNFNLSKVADVKALLLIPGVSPSGLSLGNPMRSKDAGTVFVSGATGQAGIRIAQTLLRQGFNVRAGVPDLGAAQDLALLAATYKILSKEETRRLNAVESSYEDAKTIAKAIGNASKVVVTIGCAENGPSGVVTIADALLVIEAAQLAGVGHVAIVYDSTTTTTALSTGINVLDGISSFFGNLFSRTQQLTVQQLLQALVQTDVKYTFIKTRLTDDFSPEGSYNVVVAAEGTSTTSAAAASDYKVAKSQIATLVANVFSDTAIAENKVVEVSTDPEAPSKPVNELFSAIPEDGRRKAYAEAVAKEKAAEEAKIASERALEAAKATQELEEEVRKLEQQKARAASLAEDAQAKAEAAGAPSLESLLDKAKKGMSSGLSWESLSSQLATAVGSSEASSEKPKVQIATVRGQAKARSLTGIKAVIKEEAPPKAKEEAPKEVVVGKSNVQVNKFFGGLFQQETIYVDEEE